MVTSNLNLAQRATPPQPLPFPQTADDLRDNIFISIFDMDGTVIRSYDAMLVTTQTDFYIPRLFTKHLLGKFPEGSPERSYFSDKLRSYFKIDPASVEPDQKHTAISRITELFHQEGHKHALHQPLETYRRVVDRVVGYLGTLEHNGIKLLQGDDAERLRRQASLLEQRKFTQLFDRAHEVYSGFGETIHASKSSGGVNAIYTNTEVTFALLKLLRAKEHGKLIDINLLDRVYAKIDVGCAQMDDDKRKGAVRWDGTSQDFKENLLPWLKQMGLSVDANEMPRLQAIYNLVRPFKGNKPNPEPVQLIQAEFAPQIEARANAALQSNNPGTKSFKLQPQHTVMVGESVSDLGSTILKVTGERIARFFWQLEGVHFHKAVYEADARIRKSTHLYPWQEIAGSFNLEAKSDLILPRGFRSLLYTIGRGKLAFGLNPRIESGLKARRAASHKRALKPALNAVTIVDSGNVIPISSPHVVVTREDLQGRRPGRRDRRVSAG